MTTKQVILVYGEEANLVQAANLILSRAEQAAFEEAGMKGTPGMIFYSPRDAPIIDAYENLRLQYKHERGLTDLPVLVAGTSQNLMAPNPAPWTSASAPFHLAERSMHKDDAPTVMELEKILIQRIPLKRDGQAVYRWKDGYYHRLSDSDLMTLIHQTLITELEIKGAANQLAGVQVFLTSDPAIQDTPIDGESSRFLCVKNGLLDLQTLQLQPHDPRFFFTSQIDVEWLGNQPSPRFDAFLHQIAGGNELLIRRLWQTTGYILMPDNHAKRFILLQGLGNSGKSVYGNLLESFFDQSAVGNLSIFRFQERFALSSLVDKRLNLAMDLPQGELSDQAVAAIKEITGRDAITVEEKYKAPRSAVLNCSLVFGSNHMLRLKTPDGAFAKRILLIPFQKAVPEQYQDHFLLEKLKTERSGILFQAIQAYREVVAANYTFAGDDFYTFDAQVGEQHVSPAEGIADFIQCCCMEADTFTPTEVLFNRYATFATERNGFAVQNVNAFSRQFAMLCGDRVKNKKQRVNGVPVNGYLGVALREEVI